MTQLSDVPNAGLPPWRWFPCLHRDPAVSPPGAVARSGASSELWKNLSEIDTKRAKLLGIMNFLRGNQYLKPSMIAIFPRSFPERKFIKSSPAAKQTTMFPRFYRSSRFSTFIFSASSNESVMLPPSFTVPHPRPFPVPAAQMPGIGQMPGPLLPWKPRGFRGTQARSAQGGAGNAKGHLGGYTVQVSSSQMGGLS